jgi:hypothetical protein
MAAGIRETGLASEGVHRRRLAVDGPIPRTPPEVPTMVKTDSRKVNQRRRLRRQKLESRARLRELRATPKVEAKS